MQKINLLLCILLLATPVFAGCEGLPSWLKFGRPAEPVKQAAPEIEGTVLALVNGRSITLEDFNQRVEAYNREIQGSQDITEEQKRDYLIATTEAKKRLLDTMVQRELLIAEAIKRGLEQEPDLRQAIAELKEQLLFARIIELEKAKVSLGTREIENFYNINKDAFTVPEERRVSVIVVPSEGRAKEILIQLLQGQDFGTLARDNSTDESATSGGDIGFIVQTSPFLQPDKKTMFKKFEEVVFSAELNRPSAVFQGPDGFYIVKVTKVEEARQMLLSEVYNDIEQGLTLRQQEESLQALIDNLRKGANLVVHEELLSE